MRASATYLHTRDNSRVFLAGDGELSNARAVAIVVHGGKEESLAAVTNRQVAVLRMAPIATMLAKRGAPHGLAVWRLLFRFRGWNNELAHPVEDLVWAVEHMRDRHGDAPIVLVGHSMGGRAALRVAGQSGVSAVLGLAPWLPPGEPYEQLAGRTLLVVHGTNDRITGATQSRDFVRAASGFTAEAAYIALRRSGHAMMRRARTWHRLTHDFVLHAGLRREPSTVLADAFSKREIVL